MKIEKKKRMEMYIKMWNKFFELKAKTAIIMIKRIRAAHQKQISDHKKQISVLMNRIKNKKAIIKEYNKSLYVLRNELK